MPAFSERRQEAFAAARAKGMGVGAAYAAVGYVPNSRRASGQDQRRPERTKNGPHATRKGPATDLRRTRNRPEEDPRATQTPPRG